MRCVATPSKLRCWLAKVRRASLVELAALGVAKLGTDAEEHCLRRAVEVQAR